MTQVLIFWIPGVTVVTCWSAVVRGLLVTVSMHHYYTSGVSGLKGTFTKIGFKPHFLVSHDASFYLHLATIGNYANTFGYGGRCPLPINSYPLMCTSIYVGQEQYVQPNVITGCVAVQSEEMKCTSRKIDSDVYTVYTSIAEPTHYRLWTIGFE